MDHEAEGHQRVNGYANDSGRHSTGPEKTRSRRFQHPRFGQTWLRSTGSPIPTTHASRGAACSIYEYTEKEARLGMFRIIQVARHASMPICDWGHWNTSEDERTRLPKNVGDGQGVNKCMPQRASKAVIGATGFGVHSLRATAATNPLDHEVYVINRHDWLWHASVATIRVYDRRKNRPGIRLPQG